MENNKNEIERDEIINPEQFQVGRAPEDEKTDQPDDTQYTPGETEFADGEGTQLAEAFDTEEKSDDDDELNVEWTDEMDKEELDEEEEPG